MRLLDTTTLCLKDFITVDQAPQYAILSHTWGAEEVTYKDLRSGQQEDYQQKQGWRKITESARYASRRGWGYIWIDTCCIDKSDITELSEAINSMFHWYERAQVCYAYLADVPPLNTSASNHPWKWSFRSSRWFTRGWTLQELLAPSFLEFLDSEWNLIGSRDEWVVEIERATGIEVKQLANFQQCCIATKLSWAAHRQTTRVEDRAYSMLGLLGVNMPLIYGEGERAFARLQLELMRSSNDESIFVWGPAMISGRIMPNLRRQDIDTATRRHRIDAPILAPSPKDYEHSRGLTTHIFDPQRRGFSMTNAGLNLNAELFKMPSNRRNTDTLYLIKLNCTFSWPPLQEAWTPLVLFLRDPDSRESDDSDKVPLFFRKVQFPPLTWRMTNSGQWISLGRHDILVANDAAPVRDNFRSGNSANFRFVKPDFNNRPDDHNYRPVNHYYRVARLATDMDWTMVLVDRPPKVLFDNEAFIYNTTTRSATGPDEVGYVVIVKWNRWTRRGLMCGLWPLTTRRGMAGANDQIRELLTDGDRDQPYQHTAAPVSELCGPVKDGVVMALHITARRDTVESGRRQFVITLATKDLSEREGRPNEDIFPVVARKREEYDPFRYREQESSSDGEWSDVPEESQDDKAKAKVGAFA